MIRKFKIINGKYNEIQGWLFYDTESKKYEIKKRESYKAMHPDFIFALSEEVGMTDIPEHIVWNWVSGRVITPNRQGIEDTLKSIGLKKYDIFDMLLNNHGICQMDFDYISEYTDDTVKDILTKEDKAIWSKYGKTII